MNSATVPIGKQIDADLRDSARSLPISAPKLKTVQDLLAALQGTAYLKMLRTTAGHISTFLKVPVEQLRIEALVDVGPAFRLYLKEHRFKRNAVRSYSNFAGMLLREARARGWESPQPETPEEWKSIFALLRQARGNLTRDQYHACAKIVRYAIRQGRTPSDFCGNDVNAWGEEFLKQGRSYGYMVTLRSNFRTALIKSGLAEKLPGISCSSQKNRRYGVSLRFFPIGLRNEVEALLEWKQAPYAEGRPRQGRLRPNTAEKLENCISRLYGFVTKIQKRKHVPSLVQLVTKKSMVSYIEWCLNDRGLKSRPLIGDLSVLCAAMRWNPAYKAYDLRWFSKLLSEIPLDSESERRERKASKYLPYDVLLDIPKMIRSKREEVAKLGGTRLAWLVHDELLLSWLTILVWRQRNIRECRLDHNLFKKEIPPLVNMAIPYWVQERIKVNPHERFWQFYFREPETKTSHEVRAILPRQLVSLLEEYLQCYRRILLGGSDDPGTLFLNRWARPLTRAQMVDVVSELTRRYKQRRVTPHLFRDILAFKWLDGHPEDYLTLSKVLWHRDINTTLRIYGCKFDESHGLRRVEEWLDREQEQKYLPHAAAAEGSADLGTESHSEQVRLQPGIMQKISNLASKSDAFQALPPAAKQRELSAIASIIEAHPWLTKLFGYELRKEAVGTSQESGFRAIRRKLAA